MATYRINSAIKRTGGRSEPRATDYVRRRRWIRHRQRVVAAPAALPSAAAPQTEEDKTQDEDQDDDEEEETENQSDDAQGNDDEEKAKHAGTDNQSRVSRLASAPKRIEDVANDLNIDDDDAEDDGDGYDEDDEAEMSAAAVTSNQTDTSDDRSVASPPLSMNPHDASSAFPSLSPTLESILRAATTPQVPPPTATAPQLELFSMTMDKAAVDAAWNAAVKELEAIYTRAKTHKAQRLKQWRVAREKLKRQIHVLEKTIASMETVALEEEKRRRTSASANNSPRKPSFASGSPHAAATPPATPGRSHPVNKNAVNVVNLAAKMQSAQSKLDALKRLLWHSREKQYTLRFSIDGIFYGLRDFHVESFTSSYAIHMSHQTNGAQGITPTCKIVLKGHTVCVGKHVKVTGDKGTRVPKSIWERMYLDTDFDASIYLIYVDDVLDNDASPTRERHGRWEFLFTPDATRVELINFTRRVQGGLDLPEPVVRKLCSDVLSSLVRDLALIYFPRELATAFDAPPAKLDLVGNVSLTGLAIDDVLEREIENMSDTRDESSASASSSKSLLAAAAQLLVFRDSDASMHRIADALKLSPAQFNLLVALKDCGLYPHPYSFRTLASLCEYYARFFVDERPASAEERDAYTQRLRLVWKQVIELLYIRKVRASGTDATPPLALFDMDALWDTVERLSQKPAAVELTVTRLHCSVRAQSVVDAVAKLYERLVLGVDFSKPRAGYDAFLYGFRFGRKAAAVPKAVATAVADATSHAATPAATALDPRLQIPLDSAFRARLKAFSQFVRTLKAAVDVATHNVESMSVEVAGHLKGTGGDCDLSGSFRDVDFVGPVHVALGVPACFLGLYRIETVAVDSGDNKDSKPRVGLQIELLLPRAAVRPSATTRRRKQPLAATLESVGRVLVTDLATQVLVDVDALVEQHRIRSASAAAEMTAPWSPTKSFARRVETQPTHAKHEALAFSFGHCASQQQRSSNASSLGDGVTCVSSTSDLDAPLAKASSPFTLATSEFTKLHARVRAGSFATRMLPILDYVLATYVRPLVQSSCPEHHALLDSVLASALQWLSAPSMALDFDVVTRACIHGRDDLVITIASAPLHAAPIVYKDELLLLPLIIHADDLVNQWIDDRYPPYSNPLYF